MFAIRARRKVASERDFLDAVDKVVRQGTKFSSTYVLKVDVYSCNPHIACLALCIRYITNTSSYIIGIMRGKHPFKFVANVDLLTTDPNDEMSSEPTDGVSKFVNTERLSTIIRLLSLSFCDIRTWLKKLHNIALDRSVIVKIEILKAPQRRKG